MKIFRYNEDLQRVAKSKTKPEPWLHFMQLEDGSYAIYVWDTREVLEVGKSKMLILSGTLANDNLALLVGKNVDVFNAALTASNIRITSKHEGTANRPVTVYFANGIPVCKTETWKDAFCSTNKRTGTTSLVRSKISTAKQTYWLMQGLQKLFPNASTATLRAAFVDDYPNFRYGYHGHAITKAAVQTLITNFANEQ